MTTESTKAYYECQTEGCPEAAPKPLMFAERVDADHTCSCGKQKRLVRYTDPPNQGYGRTK
jgi:hypothetical protein